MRLLRLVLFIWVSLLFGQSYAESSDVKLLLFETLQPILAEKHNEGKRIIRYCPDNLCLLIESPGNIRSDLLYEFSILFFFYEADFPEFRQSEYLLPTGVNPRDKFGEIAPKLLKKYVHNSCEDSQNESVCVLQRIRSEYGIKTYFTRIDEGYSIKE